MYKHLHWNLLPIWLVLALSACSETPIESKPRQERTQTVVSESVVWQPRLTRIEAVGTSRARQSVTLFPEATGEVAAVNFRAGERVEAGKTLVQLEARDEILARDAAKVNLADAERLLSRYRRSEGAGAVTQSALDEAESAVTRARIALARAEVALDDRSIKAPYTGVTGLTTIDPGAQVDPSTVITTLDDRCALLVTFAVPETFYGQLQPGQEVTVSPWNHGSANERGRIVEVDSRIDPANRTFAVRAEVNNHADRLRPGMSFRVLLELEDGRYPVVPEIALRWGGDGAYVWTVKDGTAQRIAATVVARQQGSVLVEAELPEGMPVVVEGIQNLREGASVEEFGLALREDRRDPAN